MTGKPNMSDSVTWQDRYQDKIMSAQQAVRKAVKPGDRVFIGSGCGEPTFLVSALAEMSSEKKEILSIINMGLSPYERPKYDGSTRFSTLFIGERERQSVLEGQMDYTPIFLSEIPMLFRQRRISLDVSLIQVSPPNEQGLCSYGVSVDITKAAAESSDCVIAQVNPNMPRTLGDSFIHCDDIDFMVPSDNSILEYPRPEETGISMRIGAHAARIIDDGSTLQIGIGSIPDAVLSNLLDKEDIGIHTEMISDGMIDLVDKGVITGEKKTIHKGKIIGSIAMGTKKLFDFIDNNPVVEMRPSEYTNNWNIVARNLRMCSINSVVQIDVTGRSLLRSAIGGQMDFIRGAQRSVGGKSILCLPATAETAQGRVSRIVPHLTGDLDIYNPALLPHDVHFVCTEYGTAYLHGKGIRDRVKALISIAHPDYRQELIEYAKKQSWVYRDQDVPMDDATVYPVDLRRQYKIEDGPTVLIRAIKPTDEELIQDLYYKLSEESVYLRWFQCVEPMPHEKAMNYCNIDYRERMGIVGEIQETGQIIAMAGYDLDPRSNLAEVAFVVRDEFQNMGLGVFLLKFLEKIAHSNGIMGFTACVLRRNRAMMEVFKKTGFPLEIIPEDDMFFVKISFEHLIGWNVE